MKHTDVLEAEPDVSVLHPSVAGVGSDSDGDIGMASAHMQPPDFSALLKQLE